MATTSKPEPPDPGASWWSAREAAAALGLGPVAVYDLAAKGEIASHRIGPRKGRIKFRPADVQAYIDSCRRGPGTREAAPAKPRLVHVRTKTDHGF